MKQKNKWLMLIFLVLAVIFAVFLLLPVIRLLIKSFWTGSSLSLEYYRSVLTGKHFGKIVANSFLVSAVSALFAVLIAFVMAYRVHYTKMPQMAKKIIQSVAVLPMFLPTITYGFAIIYSFGKQGLITRLFGFQLFNIYGFAGLLIGYVIYTIPVAYLLIHNTMSYVDKKTLIVSKVMGDRVFSTFWIAVLRPLLGTLAAAFIQTFFLCFTDFGIPASVGGKYDVIATSLYNEMLGGVPDFNRGAVVSVIMLLPSIVSILLLRYLERYNIRYDRINDAELKANKARDVSWGMSCAVLSLLVIAMFLVIFVVPLVERWPYKTAFTLEHFQTVFADHELRTVYLHSIGMAVLTAFFGTLIAYGAALITARSSLPGFCKGSIESLALITNTIPGMVMGLALMFSFSGSSWQNTFQLMILCNIVHYFSTPYLMMKNSLSKMSASWETTGMLMGDSWLKTVLRVVTPNAASSLIEVFSYYFINSMVTISALVFITGAKTMVLTTKIKQLQYVNKYNEVFVLLPWISLISGKEWRKEMVNGVSLLRPMWFWPLPRRWKNWKKKAVFRPVLPVMIRIRSFWQSVSVRWAFGLIWIRLYRAPSLPAFVIRRGQVSASSRCTNISRRGVMSSIRARLWRQTPSA